MIERLQELTQTGLMDKLKEVLNWKKQMFMFYDDHETQYLRFKPAILELNHIKTNVNDIRIDWNSGDEIRGFISDKVKFTECPENITQTVSADFRHITWIKFHEKVIYNIEGKSNESNN